MLEMLASFYDAGQEMRTSKEGTSMLKEVLCPTCPFCHESLYVSSRFLASLPLSCFASFILVL